MPIYEYQCEKCGVFDVMQKITEKPLRKCPTCKSKVSKLLSNSAFHLKGSGWYITDYARKSGDKAEKSSESKSIEAKASDGTAEKSSESGASSSGSSDAKPAKTKKPKASSSKAANAA